ncbi:DUF397 domain-containing protein [Streptomyces clavuligerus]|uniref:DUF397 domain-containing protein n=1 Tax=Streptomyces clavuligerus TaxID=1901 RepID=UPI0018D107C2|nr:DUF397 domain-containing protein [Streptomyces clavuligerus]
MFSDMRWRKSSYSGASGGSCLEIVYDLPGIVPVRDSKAAPEGPVLVFRSACWNAFIDELTM